MPFFTSTWLGALALLWSSAFAGKGPNRSPWGVFTHGDSFVPDYVLRATYENASIACTTRESVMINGTIPGPELRLQENRTTFVRVYNDMVGRNLTIHWHGLSASVAPFSDGTPLVSQWPIPPAHFFDYELHPDIGEAGTFFYHSHVEFQAVTAAGPLIVEEVEGVEPPYAYDEERIMLLSELYNKTDDAIHKGLLATPFVWSGEPNTFLVNGNAYAPNNTALNNSECRPEIIEVEPDKTYRFRVIGGSALSLLLFEIESHDTLTIIEADGSYTQPFNVSRIQASSGQRFDFLLRTMSADEIERANQTDYFIQIEDRLRPSTPVSYAILRYTNCGKPSWVERANSVGEVPPVPSIAPLSLPTNTTNITSWLEYSLEPLTANDFPTASEVTRRVVMTVAQVYIGPNSSYQTARWQENGQQWSEEYPNTTNNYLPYLVEIYQNGQASVPSVQVAEQYGGYDPTTNTWPAQLGEVLEIVIQNAANNQSGSWDSHPFHAHGGHYYDIGSGSGIYDPVANEEKLKGYNPVLRDTTMLYRYTAEGHFPKFQLNGWRAWRLRVEDAGAWMIHCHSLQHMLMGMQTVWIMGDAAQIQAKLVPDSGYFVNGSDVISPIMEGYLTYGGRAYGNASFDPEVMHWFH